MYAFESRLVLALLLTRYKICAKGQLSGDKKSNDVLVICTGTGPGLVSSTILRIRNYY